MHWPCHYDGNSNNIMSYLFTLVTAWQPYGSDTNVNMHLHCKQRNKTTILVITSICHISYNGDTHITVHQQSRGCHHGDGTVCHGIWHTTLRAKTLYAIGKIIVCHRQNHCMLLVKSSYAIGGSVRRQITVGRNAETYACTTLAARCSPKGSAPRRFIPYGRMRRWPASLYFADVIGCHARLGQRGRRVCCASVPHTWHA